MSHGHVHEEAEHASHHAGNPFDKVVAMTMVVIAALLAGVKVLAHRAHNDTLAYQIKAGVEKGESNSAETAAASQWAFFQSKKMREVLALQDAKLLLQLAPRGTPVEKPTASLPDRDKRLAALEKELADEKVENYKEVAQNILKKIEARHVMLLKAGYPPEKVLPVVDAEMTAARYRAEGVAIRKKAIKEKESADKHSAKGAKYRQKSDALHHQTDWFDAGELGIDLAIVLCSVAILVKAKKFWFAGMAVALIGAIVVAIGLFR